jgi:hypothetical protein
VITGLIIGRGTTAVQHTVRLSGHCEMIPARQNGNSYAYVHNVRGRSSVDSRADVNGIVPLRPDMILANDR